MLFWNQKAHRPVPHRHSVYAYQNLHLVLFDCDCDRKSSWSGSLGHNLVSSVSPGILLHVVLVQLYMAQVAIAASARSLISFPTRRCMLQTYCYANYLYATLFIFPESRLFESVYPCSWLILGPIGLCQHRCWFYVGCRMECNAALRPQSRLQSYGIPPYTKQEDSSTRWEISLLLMQSRDHDDCRRKDCFGPRIRDIRHFQLRLLQSNHLRSVIDRDLCMAIAIRKAESRIDWPGTRVLCL